MTNSNSVSSPSQRANTPLPAREQIEQLFHLTGFPIPQATPQTQPTPSTQSLKDAYHICKQLTNHHSKSFFFSTLFLPAEKRDAVYALYAFCRTSDDTVDMAQGDPAQALAAWVHQVRNPTTSDNPVIAAWHDTRQRYHLSQELEDELLAGVAMDLTINRYASFADLWLYCYRVASVVGLLSMGIIGTAPGAEPYAIKQGVALQMTNILRDVGEDARRGRVYLPQEDLEAFGLQDEDILQEHCDERFRKLMQFEIARTHRLYDESWQGIVLLPKESRLAVGVAAQVYRGILDKIIVNNYDTFHYRAHLTRLEKWLLLPKTWHAIRQLGKHPTKP